MKREIKEAFEKFGFVVDEVKDEIHMPTYSYDIEAFVFHFDSYDVSDVEKVELNLELAKEFEDYFHGIVYALGHIKDKVEKM